MLNITQAALDQIRQAAGTSQAEGLALRVAARRADDGSVAYGMGFDPIHEQDEEQVYEGVTVVVATHSRDLLDGTVLDFVELEPGERGFVFIPKVEADATRGCSSGGCTRCGSGC